jgi:hypothetical protein
MAHDEENDWAGLYRCQAIALMWQGLEQIVLDSDTHPGWTLILDPEDEPSQWLPWTATAIYGVELIPGSDTEEQRARIKELPPQKRGGVDALINGVKQTLTGAKTVNLFERAPGDAYLELIVTDLADTPNPAATLAAVREQKLAGVKQIYVATETWLVAEVEATYPATGGVGQLESDLATVKDVEEHGVI